MTARLRVAIAAHLWLLDGDGRMLFARRANTGYADGLWSVPAGHVEPGETFEQACVREAEEEIGLALRPQSLSFTCLQQKLDHDGEERVDVFFSAALPVCGTVSIREPDRCDGLCWTPPDEPPAPTVPYIAAALAHVRRGGGPLAHFGYAEVRGSVR